MGKIEECFQKTQNGGPYRPRLQHSLQPNCTLQAKEASGEGVLQSSSRTFGDRDGKGRIPILHVQSTVKRCWVYPKIVFTKPKSFVPSCYTMKEWTEIKKKKTTIVQKLTSCSAEKKLIVDGEVAETHWRADFKAEYKFTSASMGALMREGGKTTASGPSL